MRRSFSEFQNVSVQTAKLADYQPVSNPDVAAIGGRASLPCSVRTALPFWSDARGAAKNLVSGLVGTISPHRRQMKVCFWQEWN
jgi:hypothetical protein